MLSLQHKLRFANVTDKLYKTFWSKVYFGFDRIDHMVNFYWTQSRDKL